MTLTDHTYSKTSL